ncbi:MAG: hypothetical protein HY706_18830 [Candidatus Hydrogenedentes bacterium]|nr:hypothetical protein [Candidatus Hydrogenedentota bacterium]
MKLWIQLFLGGAFIVFSLLFFLYPAITVARIAMDSELRATGQCRLTHRWFTSAAGRFDSWATEYLDTAYASSVRHEDVAATEWPMFGAVFFLLTAETLYRQGKFDTVPARVRDASEKAARIVASPVTATWVKTKWGEDYLEQENVFYRMLLIMGLSSYERLTGNSQYRSLMSHQRKTLAQELEKAPFHLRDDYPGECYPSDVLWAVAAIQHAEELENVQPGELGQHLMAVLDGPVKAPEGLPAFQVDAESGSILQGARGCGNSGILVFAAELDPLIAQDWYRAHEANFWQVTGWAVGFREFARGALEDFMDVDSGPVLFGFGSVASVFGIGAAKSVGRVDHAAPLTMEAVACAWPTPFGFLIPGIMGKLAADSWSLGEVALLFSMTRPTIVSETVPFTGSAPLLVWVLLAIYAILGLLFIALEIRSCRRLIRRNKERRRLPKTISERE